jgi:hypothetical protein
MTGVPTKRCLWGTRFPARNLHGQGVFNTANGRNG